MSSCPICGAGLSVITSPDANTAPWVCVSCCRGWWNAELEPAIVASFDPILRTWGDDTAIVLAAIDVEREEA